MARPSSRSDEINQRLVDAIYPEVLLWLRVSGDHEPQNDEEGIKRDLLKALRYSGGDDPYRMMKNLEDDCYWMVDSDLQDAFERVGPLRYKYHDEAVAAWVQANNIAAIFAVGTPVQVTLDRKPVVGEILEVDAKHGKYVVHCPSLGHVKVGIGTHGTVLPFEDVRAVPPDAQAESPA